MTVAKVTPDVVTLSGESALLDKQAYLETEPVDVHNLMHDSIITTRLHVPSGLAVVEKSEVRIDLRVQLLSQ